MTVSDNGSEGHFLESLKEQDFQMLFYLRVTFKEVTIKGYSLEIPWIYSPWFYLGPLETVYIFILFHFLS
jgi:hypothetical protein